MSYVVDGPRRGVGSSGTILVMQRRIGFDCQSCPVTVFGPTYFVN